MTIFVAYSFAEEWVRKSIIPLIELLGFQVETGKELAGKPLDEGVKNKINGADGLVAFLTRKTQIAGARKFKTSDWVLQELTHGNALGKRVLEVIEADVDFDSGLTGNRERIPLDPSDRLATAVAVCRALRTWKSGIDVELRLGGELFVGAIRGLLSDPTKYRCSYRIRDRRGKELDLVTHTDIIRREGGLFVYPEAVPPDAFIEFRIEFNGEVWTSSGRNVQTIDINLEKGGA